MSLCFVTLRHVMKLSFAAMICVLSSALAGCDSDGGEVPLEKFSAEVTSAYCAFAARCRAIESEKTCQMAGPVDLGKLVAAVKAGRVVYDAKLASSCLAELREQSCTFSSERQNTACENLTKPAVASGGRCSDRNECLSGECELVDPQCLRDTACCPGTCTGAALKSDLPNGTTCFSNSECVSTFCKTTATGIGEFPVCASLPKLNEPCDFRCEPGLLCETKSNTCKRIPNTGENCTDLCNVFTDWCSDSGKCEPQIDVGKPCQKEGSCVGWATCSNGVCVARPKLGEACKEEGDGNGAAPVDCAETGPRNVQCLQGKCTNEPAEPVCP
jgi:hypothetical protein